MTKKILKSKVFYIVLVLMLILSSFALFPSASVSAAGNIISEAEMDSNLYYKLQSIAGGTLRDDSFYNNSKEITELDLSFSALGAVSTAKKISSLDGLELLDLRKITVLKVNNQNISEITESNLSGMPNLERLEISGNALTQINISQNAKLKVFIADNNQISSIDLSVMDASGFETENSVISLKHNRISSFEDITLPQTSAGSKLTVNLENNNITDVLPENSTYTLNLGLQGLRSLGYTEENIITTTQEIKFFGFENDTLSAKITKINGTTESVVKELKNPVSNVVTTTLTVGEYKVDFYEDETLINENSEFSHYKSFAFTVLPPSPTYYFIIDGEKVERVDKLTKTATLVIEGVENSKTYYSIDGAEWVEGNSVELTSGGRYPITLKAVIGEYESLYTNIYITASPNLYLSEGILILLIVLLGGVFVVAFILIKKYVLDK